MASKWQFCATPSQPNPLAQYLASQAGVFWWHSSLPEHASRGLKGAIIVVDPNDPFAGKYKGDLLFALSEARARPEVCLDAKVK